MICPKCNSTLDISALYPKWPTGYLSWNNEFECKYCHEKLYFRKSEYIWQGHFQIVVAVILYLIAGYFLAVTLKSDLVLYAFLIILFPVYIGVGRYISKKALENCHAYLKDKD